MISMLILSEDLLPSTRQVRVKFWEEVEEEHARPGFFAKLGLFKSSS